MGVRVGLIAARPAVAKSIRRERENDVEREEEERK